MAEFPTEAWVYTLMEKLNADSQYADIAKNWEGDMLFRIEPAGNLKQSLVYYLDLWHGKCRGVEVVADGTEKDAVIYMSANYVNISKVIRGETEVFQALLTRKISVKGNMALLMRNVPTVLDFVRCCREITDSFI